MSSNLAGRNICLDFVLTSDVAVFSANSPFNTRVPM
jgi:hypothetical protein